MLWTTSQSGVSETAGVNAASSSPGLVNLPSTPNSKGSWAQLIAATTRPSYGLFIASRGAFANGVNNATIFDVAIGGSGSESIIVENAVLGSRGLGVSIFVPIYLPAGVRLAARGQQGDSAAYAAGFQVILNSTPGPAWARATTYGANTATSAATNLATSTAADTKSVWTEITAATTSLISYLVVIITASASTNLTTIRGIVDIGVGAAGSERVIAADLSYRVLATGDIAGSTSPGMAIQLPVGTRLAARWAGDTTGQAPSVSLIGVG